MCTNQDISNIPFIMRGTHFLVHGHKKDLLHITCIFHLLKNVVKIFLVSAILHHIFLLRLLPKSYFRSSTFEPNFLCSSSFNMFGKYMLDDLKTMLKCFQKLNLSGKNDKVIVFHTYVTDTYVTTLIKRGEYE